MKITVNQPNPTPTLFLEDLGQGQYFRFAGSGEGAYQVTHKKVTRDKGTFNILYQTLGTEYTVEARGSALKSVVVRLEVTHMHLEDVK